MSWSSHIFTELSNLSPSDYGSKIKIKLQSDTKDLVKSNQLPEGVKKDIREKYYRYFKNPGEAEDKYDKNAEYFGKNIIFRVKELDKEILNFITTFDREELKNINHPGNKFIKFVIEYLALLCPDSVKTIMTYGYIPENDLINYNMKNISIYSHVTNSIRFRLYVFESYVKLVELLLDKTDRDEATHLFDQLKNAGAEYEYEMIREYRPDLWEHYEDLCIGKRNFAWDKRTNSAMFVLFDLLKIKFKPSEMDLKYIRQGLVENGCISEKYDMWEGY
jgi:hypothetical protein